MARFTLEIETDNAAFEDNGLGSELRTMFSRVLDQLESGYMTAPVRDSNGNTCGRWLIHALGEGEDNEQQL